jgi:hypothetical protein
MAKKKLPPLGSDLGKAEYMSDAKKDRERGRLKSAIKAADAMKPKEGSPASWGRAMRKVELDRMIKDLPSEKAKSLRRGK